MLVPPLILTPRLVLRKITLDDIDALVLNANNPEISKWIVNMPYPFREPDAIFKLGIINKGFKDGQRFTFSIVLKSINELIGEITLNKEGNNQAQLGYWIGQPHWNQGYASEAIKAVVNFGFTQLLLDLIYASANKENMASIKVLENNSFKIYSKNGNIVNYYLKNPELS